MAKVSAYIGPVESSHSVFDMSSNPLRQAAVTQHEQCYDDETLEFLELLNDLEYNATDDVMSWMTVAPEDDIPPHNSRYFGGRSRLCGRPSNPVDELPNPSLRCGDLSWKNFDIGGPTTAQMLSRAPIESMALPVGSTSSELVWKSITPVLSQQETGWGTGKTMSGIDILDSSERKAFRIDEAAFDLEILAPGM